MRQHNTTAPSSMGPHNALMHAAFQRLLLSSSQAFLAQPEQPQSQQVQAQQDQRDLDQRVRETGEW
ncbi:MAG TPA: hypothetical protein VLJ57_10630 [Burkholderiaceae bacterium]|nr:hypothetical protein [Burkholderiaceae bacterium]